MFCWLSLPNRPESPVDTTGMLEEAVERKVTYADVVRLAYLPE